ncbi:MAG: PIG-L family deacetylase [Kiritimatiellae bacterium]|nr:PIG-L family deacetylase [Kiritimatiellia bacterium]
MERKRLLVIAAHPDDCDILCGGTAIKWAAAGHIVKFVSATNGDTGHVVLSRAETVKARKKEAAASRKMSGIFEYQVLDHPCGIEATLKNREKMIRLIRNFKPDVVLSHRLCDYHPDHRATAQLVLDTAYVVMVPHNCEDTPIPEKTPVYGHLYDSFLDPRPFRIDAAIEFDSVLEKKLKVMECHRTQFYEWLPWSLGRRDFDAAKLSDAEKRLWLLSFLERFKKGADEARPILCRSLGNKAGGKVVMAELFEQSPYSRQVAPTDFQKLMEPGIQGCL